MLEITPLHTSVAKSDAKVNFHLKLTDDSDAPIVGVSIAATLEQGTGTLAMNGPVTDENGVQYCEIEAPVAPGVKEIKFIAPNEAPRFTIFKVFAPNELV